jgi:hypothetical protein
MSKWSSMPRRVRGAAVGLVGAAALLAGTACAPPSAPASGLITSGVYRVGNEIAPGIYASQADGDFNYAARLDGGRNILSNDFSDRVLIEVRPSDTYVEFDGAFTGYQPRPITPPPATGQEVNGTWIVNSEVAPGTYRLAPRDGSTYWARLSDANGEQLIDNDFQNGQTYITILASDFAVELDGILLPG